MQFPYIHIYEYPIVCAVLFGSIFFSIQILFFTITILEQFICMKRERKKKRSVTLVFLLLFWFLILIVHFLLFFSPYFQIRFTYKLLTFFIFNFFLANLSSLFFFSHCFTLLLKYLNKKEKHLNYSNVFFLSALLCVCV